MILLKLHDLGNVCQYTSLLDIIAFLSLEMAIFKRYLGSLIASEAKQSLL